MIQNVLQHIGGIGVYGAISISLFFIVFTGAIVLSLCMSSTAARRRSALPLDDGQEVSTRGGGHE